MENINWINTEKERLYLLIREKLPNIRIFNINTYEPEGLIMSKVIEVHGFAPNGEEVNYEYQYSQLNYEYSTVYSTKVIPRFTWEHIKKEKNYKLHIEETLQREAMVEFLNKTSPNKRYEVKKVITPWLDNNLEATKEAIIYYKELDSCEV